MEKKLLSGREVATYLGISYQTLRNWRSEGKFSLPFVKIGKHIKYDIDDVDAYVNEAKEPAADFNSKKLAS